MAEMNDAREEWWYDERGWTEWRRARAMKAVEREIRIHATGFHDANGTWFSTWERAFPEKTFSHGLAEGPTSREMVAFHCGDGVGYGEMLLSDFLRFGLPEKRADEHAVAYAALHDCIEELDDMWDDSYTYPEKSARNGETVQRARRALQWYERHLERE